MTLLTLLKGLLSLSSAIANYMADKQLLDAGEAKAIARNLNATLKKTNAAIDARRNTKLDADSLRDDDANRD